MLCNRSVLKTDIHIFASTIRNNLGFKSAFHNSLFTDAKLSFISSGILWPCDTPFCKIFVLNMLCNRSVLKTDIHIYMFSIRDNCSFEPIVHNICFSDTIKRRSDRPFYKFFICCMPGNVTIFKLNINIGIRPIPDNLSFKPTVHRSLFSKSALCLFFWGIIRMTNHS